MAQTTSDSILEVIRKKIPDSGSLWNFRYHCVKGGIRKPLAKWIWWRQLANNIAFAEVPAGYDCFLVVNVLHYITQKPTGHYYAKSSKTDES